MRLLYYFIYIGMFDWYVGTYVHSVLRKFL